MLLDILEFLSTTSGSHFDPSVRGLLILEDTVEEWKWKAFWKHNKEGKERLKDQFTAIAESFEPRNKDEAKIICAAKNEIIETLKELVEKFVRKPVHNSEIYNTGKSFSKIFIF